MKNTAIIFAFLLGSPALFGQIKLTQLHLSSGSYMQYGDTPSEISDFNALAPGSTILMKDFSNYSGSNGMLGLLSSNRFSVGTTSNAFQSLQIGLKLPKHQGTLRLGISTFQNNLMNCFASNYESYVVDTLVSSQNGSLTFVDSTNYKEVRGNYSNQQIRLEAAYVWEVNAGERWAFSAGAGMSLGFSYQSNTSLDFSEFTNSYEGYGTYQGSQTNTFEREVFDNSTNWGANLYLPLSINLKLGKKRAFWMPWMIYSELRPQLSFNSIPTIGINFSPGIGAVTGIRYNLPSASKRTN